MKSHRTSGKLALLTLLASTFVGQMVGQTNVPEYQVIDLGTLGGTRSYGFGINKRGQVTGQSLWTNDSEWRLFVYANGSMQDRGPTEGVYRTPSLINDLGQVAYSRNVGFGGYWHAFLGSNGVA